MIDQFNYRPHLRNRQTHRRVWAEVNGRLEPCRALSEAVGRGAVSAAIQETILDFLGETLSYHKPVEDKYETVVELLDRDPQLNVTELAKAILTALEEGDDE